MKPYLENLEHMLAAWNTADEAKIREHVDAALEHNVHFVDPKNNIIGREAFVQMVLRTHKQLPGGVYSRTSDVGFQNNHCRYHWEIHQDGNLILPGFDVTEVNDAGRIVKVIGFFGELDRS